MRHCRLLSVAALGAMLAFPASAQTGSESQTPSTAAPGSESQTPSAATRPLRSPKRQAPPQPAPSPKRQAPPDRAPRPSPSHRARPLAPIRRSRRLIRRPKPPSHARQLLRIILIVVSKPAQSMTVTVDGHVRYRWRVSTGATHYSTPDGSYTPFRMELMHYSREFDNAGMPHAIFFTQRGHSIHGSDHRGLGTAVSHGCVRLTLSNATTLYQLVKSVGMAKTKVVVSGRDPPGYRVPTMPPRQPVGLFGGFFRF